MEECQTIESLKVFLSNLANKYHEELLNKSDDMSFGMWYRNSSYIQGKIDVIKEILNEISD